MRRILFLSIIIWPTLLFGQVSSTDTLKQPPKEKVGHRFYIKTEILNTLLRAVFARPTYDIDIQGTVRLNDHLHLVNTYGKATFDLSETVESAVRPGVYQFVERKGAASHRSGVMLRYYPFNDIGNAADYLFIEGGLHFQRYRGTTNANVYDSVNMVLESQYVHSLDIYRYGPQVNIGLSQYFLRKEEGAATGVKPKIIFSPEVFIGVMYNQLYLRKDEFTNIVGVTPNERYSESKVRLTFRAKLGIGFL